MARANFNFNSKLTFLLVEGTAKTIANNEANIVVWLDQVTSLSSYSMTKRLSYFFNLNTSSFWYEIFFWNFHLDFGTNIWKSSCLYLSLKAYFA